MDGGAAAGRRQIDLAAAVLSELAGAADDAICGVAPVADRARLEERVRVAVLDCTRRSDLNPHAWSMLAVTLERLELASSQTWRSAWREVARALLVIVQRDRAILADTAAIPRSP
ncbi:MAG: hypothetical protein U1E56_13735 [Bauldia sp.]